MTCSIEGCAKKVVARGWCSGHYHRWQRYGDPEGWGIRNPTTDQLLRFTAKFEVGEGGCWNWLGSKHKDGYGWFGPGGRSRAVLSHRWSYEQFVGEIPEGLYVLHHCDNPGCVNPEHLWLGTQKDNVDDCVRKGRRARQVETHNRVRADLFG